MDVEVLDRKQRDNYNIIMKEIQFDGMKTKIRLISESIIYLWYTISDAYQFVSDRLRSAEKTVADVLEIAFYK